jgi:hypothetical protein
MSLALDSSLRKLDDCACCDGLSIEAPVQVNNRPGLSAIAYRIGTHSRFKSSLVTRLGTAAALNHLRTREPGDFTMALLDAWATVADVLTFYQERIANESYLRTATERRSLLELARLIGYELRPGVAASVYLAFLVEDAKGAPREAQIPAGTRVQSIPGADELPQTFETSTAFHAHADWNAIRPRMTQPQKISTAMNSITLKGVGLNIRPGDQLLIVEENGGKALFRVKKVTQNTDAQTTVLSKVEQPGGPPAFQRDPKDPGTFIVGKTTLDQKRVRDHIVQRSWRQSDLTAMAVVQGWPFADIVINIQHQKSNPPRPAKEEVVIFRQRAAIFGHNAPDWSTLPDNSPFCNKPNWNDRNLGEENTADSPEAYIFLDNTYATITSETWLALTRPGTTTFYRVKDYAELSRKDFTLNAKVSRLTVDSLDSNDDLSNFKIRETSVLAQSEQLPLADLPITENVEKTELILDNVYFGLNKRQAIILTGERTDLEGVTESEVVILQDVVINDGYTELTFSEPLKHSYIRSTVTINANIVLATHGETKEEALGSGDASQKFQQFPLRNSPLTYISASTPSGTQSTLEVRVDGLLWHEVPSLFGRRPDERVYLTHIDDQGNTTVQFGDGQTGARLPTGAENVRARYRKGNGLSGLVQAEQISLLSSRPLGVSKVKNPLPADGAADSESREEARRNAPLTVLTLDRIVSLQDYEDFARSYVGIAKALAVWAWVGQQRKVFITVAGPLGRAIEKNGPTYPKLLEAIQQAGDPLVPVQIESYRKAFFVVVGSIKVHPDYLPEPVQTAAADALRTTFSFDARQFGQDVHQSEVISVLQSVPGVVAVDLEQFHRTDQPQNEPQPSLIAHSPEEDGNVTVGAELLLLDPRPVQLGVMK